MTIETDALLKNGTCIGEVLVLLEIANRVNHGQVMENLVRKGYITSAVGQISLYQKDYALTYKATALLDNVNADSDKSGMERNLNDLALKLKDIFPKGKKPGTAQYWTEGTALIVKRLKAFFKKYGDSYADEQILKASEEYVKSFNGNYAYMRTLKYFIWAEKVNKAGEVESTSDLLTFLEHSGEDNNMDNDWSAELR